MVRNLWIVSSILSIVGIILALYLLNLYYKFLPGSESVCNITAGLNCNAITTGSLATVFGVPVSLVGLIGYVFIFISTLFRKKFLMLAFSLFGFLFCLRITILEVFFVKVLCPVCLACQAVMLILLVISLYLIISRGKKQG